MKKTRSHIYPGEFIPIDLNNGEIDNSIDYTSNASINNCMVNVSEDDSHLEMDVFLPGLNKEDINIEVKNDSILIIVNHFDILTNNTKFLVHEFENYHMSRKIKIPKLSDIDFITATFDHGLLKIHVPKSKTLSYGKPHQIAIY